MAQAGRPAGDISGAAVSRRKKPFQVFSYGPAAGRRDQADEGSFHTRSAAETVCRDAVASGGRASAHVICTGRKHGESVIYVYSLDDLPSPKEPKP